MPIVGRKAEQQILTELLNSQQPEFIAVYGRRRVGKTFLMREFFSNKKNIFFNTTGSKEGSLAEQINHFTQEIGNTFYQGMLPKKGKNWDETFSLLTKAIQAQPTNKKIILFLDEFPWMATRKSRLLQQLDYYWNQHWSRDKRVKLIICGSSASWIVEKIINNKGGLYNRLTRQMLLEPFHLSDAQLFLKAKGIKLNTRQITKIYMLTGGVPYYLNQVKKGLSAAQNIEQLAFSKNSPLIDEFDKLFSSLFNTYEIYVELVRLIASYHQGISQVELFKKMGKNFKGKSGLTKLKELEDTGFITAFKSHFHQKKGIYYKAADEYVLFYLKWIEPIKETLLKKGLIAGYWDKQQTSPTWHSWAGLAFETLCYKHLPQISTALRLSPTALPNTWRYAPIKNTQEAGAQIDLLFDRDDDAITLCEIKYTDQPFVIDKKYAQELKQKMDVFKKVTKTKKQLFLAMISANGLKPTAYAEIMIDGLVTLDDLFLTL